jgi:glycosyltransferase involved in cell wall biosynthesis
LKEKLACALIVRDDATTLRACLESIRPYVDELVCLDTGSQDGSPAIAREYADKVSLFLGCNDERTGLIENFGMARNAAWSMVESSVCCWMDADDVLLRGDLLRPFVEQAPSAPWIGMMRYDYAPDTEQDRERIVFPRHSFTWHGPVHEVLIAKEPLPDLVVRKAPDELRMSHRKLGSGKVQEPGRNLRILLKHLAQVGETDPRAIFYAGSEHACHGNLGESVRMLRRYVEIGNNDEERCAAMVIIARQYQAIGDHRTALDWATKATHEKAEPEPYFLLARSYYSLAMAGDDPAKNFRRAAHFAQYGLTMVVDSPLLLWRDPRSRKEIYEYLNVCLSRIGDLEGAIKSCEDGLRLDPGNADLMTNLALYRQHRARRTVQAATLELQQSGAIDANQAKVIELALASKVSLGFSDEAPAAAVPAEAMPAPREGLLRIVFYVGHGLEPWSPKTIAEHGQGGSEIMAWEMARRLAKLGHSVRLYGHLSPQMEGDYEGVQYLDASRYRNVRCDVLIASRQPAAVDDEFGCEAHARVLWVHDVHVGEALNMARSLRFDRILVLTEWHREFFLKCYPQLPRNKVVVTRNGIDPEMFSAERELDTRRGGAVIDTFVTELAPRRNPHRAIYASSPDRGLLTAVECWPDVRKEVPDAELHVFYGFGNWEKVARLSNDSAQLRDINHLRHLLSNTEGVVVHDRVSPAALAVEMLKSGVWAYPTWWTETSCITAMAAQAAGLRCVTSPIAALNETCDKRNTVFVRGKGEEHEWWRQADYKRQWTHEVVQAMTIPEHGKLWDRRDITAAAIEQFSLVTLAAEWSRHLLELVLRVTEEVVPRFSAPVQVEAAQ